MLLRFTKIIHNGTITCIITIDVLSLAFLLYHFSKQSGQDKIAIGEIAGIIEKETFLVKKSIF